MLTLKYVKKDGACFISHIDLLRHTSRALRRAEIPVKFSQGFNPHALIYFSPPLGVGISSEAEYMAIDTDMEAAEAFELYNASVPSSLKAVAVFKTDKNPNLQGKTVCADYLIDTPYAPLDLSEGLEISYKKKDAIVTENVADRIYAAFEENGKLCVRLALGNVNLRPDRILPAINERLKISVGVTDVKKIRQYIEVDKKAVEVDEFLKSISVK